jgi:hypothetical protein
LRNNGFIKSLMRPAMIAYLFGKTLTIVARPCNGVEFQNGEHIAVAGKREANAICKARGLKAWNF